MILSGLVAAMAVAGCKMMVGGASIVGSGPVKTEARQLASFSKVSVGGGFFLDVTIGKTQSVVVEAQENLLPVIETKVDSDTLEISTNSSSIQSDKPMLVHVVIPSLTACNVSGGAQAEIKGITEREFDGEVSGGGRLKMDGTADSIKIDASGGAQIVLNGLAAKTVTCGGTGGSTILLQGSADQGSFNAAGGAQVHGEDFKVASADATATGAGTIVLNVSKSLTATASGASSIRYAGDAKVSSKVTGASSVSHLP